MCISIYRSIYLSLYLSIALSISRSIHLSIYLSLYLSLALSIYRSIYLSLYLSIALSIYRSIYLSLYLSIALSIYPSISRSIYLSIALSIYPSLALSIYLSISLSIYLSLYLSITLSISRSIYLSLYLSLALSIYRSIHLSLALSIYLSIYLSLYLYLALSISRSIHLSLALSISRSLARSIYLYIYIYIISIFKLFWSVANTRIVHLETILMMFCAPFTVFLTFSLLDLKCLLLTFLKPAETVHPWRFNVSERRCFLSSLWPETTLSGTRVRPDCGDLLRRIDYSGSFQEGFSAVWRLLEEEWFVFCSGCCCCWSVSGLNSVSLSTHLYKDVGEGLKLRAWCVWDVFVIVCVVMLGLSVVMRYIKWPQKYLDSYITLLYCMNGLDWIKIANWGLVLKVKTKPF